MSWQDVDTSTVNPNDELIPEGEYVFRLVRAALNPIKNNAIECRAAIASEGEFQGRQVFFSYSDPSVYAQSPKLVKRLEIALGIDAMPGEAPPDFLTRAAGMQPTFGGKVYHDKWTPDGSDQPRVSAKLNLWSVKPGVV